MPNAAMVSTATTTHARASARRSAGCSSTSVERIGLAGRMEIEGSFLTAGDPPSVQAIHLDHRAQSGCLPQTCSPPTVMVRHLIEGERRFELLIGVGTDARDARC